MVKMKPVHGYAAETTAATILAVTGTLGMPVSTTHTITTSIMGVGAARRWNAIEWSLVERIVWAWIMTMPITALLAYGIAKLVELVF
jgi:PiT family inorganic phosphate transporter